MRNGKMRNENTKIVCKILLNKMRKKDIFVLIFTKDILNTVECECRQLHE